MSYTTVTVSNNRGSVWRQYLSKLIDFKNIILELAKFKITFFVSVTTFVGYILHNGKIDFNFIIPTLGVLILAGGASALNEYQERNFDSMMKRTNHRPIPSGRISAINALYISFILIFAGMLTLYLHSLLVMILGLFTLLWYNGVYTPIKKKNFTSNYSRIISGGITSNNWLGCFRRTNI